MREYFEAIELHDSELLAVMQIGSTIRVSLKAYVHRFAKDRTEAGTGWIQKVDLVFEGAAIEENIDELPCRLWDGKVTGSQGLLLLPFEMKGELLFETNDAAGNTLRVRAAGMQIERHDEPRFVEVTPPDLYRLTTEAYKSLNQNED